ILVNLMLETLRKKIFEIVAIIVSFLALQVSCSSQEYVEKNYVNAHKIIIVTDLIDKEVKLKPASDNKRILSVDMIFPQNFSNHKEFIRSDGNFSPSKEFIASLSNAFGKNYKATSTMMTVTLPIKLHTRYAISGEAYTDSSIYELALDVVVQSGGEDSNPLITIDKAELVFMSRPPTGMLASLYFYFFGTDETYDIDQMYDSGKHWKTIRFVS
ncbi:TPA: hypothetical protein ACX3GU_004826, partial [Vibrio parahaemolyticus]